MVLARFITWMKSAPQETIKPEPEPHKHLVFEGKHPNGEEIRVYVWDRWAVKDAKLPVVLSKGKDDAGEPCWHQVRPVNVRDYTFYERSHDVACLWSWAINAALFAMASGESK